MSKMCEMWISISISIPIPSPGAKIPPRKANGRTGSSPSTTIAPVTASTTALRLPPKCQCQCKITNLARCRNSPRFRNVRKNKVAVFGLSDSIAEQISSHPCRCVSRLSSFSTLCWIEAVKSMDILDGDLQILSHGVVGGIGFGIGMRLSC